MFIYPVSMLHTYIHIHIYFGEYNLRKFAIIKKLQGPCARACVRVRKRERDRDRDTHYGLYFH